MRRFGIAFIFLSVIALAPVLVSAETQQNFVPLAQKAYQGSRIGTLYQQGATQTQSFETTLNQFVIAAFWIGGVLAVIKLIQAGFLYQGKDYWDKVQRAKEIIQNVIIGLLVLFGAWLILFQINPCILDLSQLFNDFGGSGNSNGTCPNVQP